MQKKMSFKLSSAFISPLVVQVKNSLLPTPVSQQILVQIRSNAFLYESHKKNYTLDPMSLEAASAFSGIFGQMGIISVALTTMPSRSDYTLLYLGEESMLEGAICDNCNSSNLTIRGRVKFFQKSNLTIIAKSTINGTQITYAQLIAEIKYTCIAIPGCRICTNQTSPSNATSLICQKCYDKSLSNFYLLYERRCVDACPIQTYADEVNCKNCPQNCYNCSDSSTCLQCMPDFFVYMQTCVTSCPADYTKNSTHCLPQQIICPSSCKNCPEDNKCQECAQSYKLFDQSCYSQCPSGYITSKFNSSSCQLYIPPEEAKYFPFPFVICSFLLFVILTLTKCFDKKSLVMGNFLSIVSLLEFGSFLMTLVYTLVSVQLNLLLQALLFIIILSRVLLNLFFLVYFIRNIRPEEEFQQWLERYPQNIRIYYTAITLSTAVSFNIMRIIYSRLLGLNVFFGKFSSGLIFKPMNFFSIALSLIYSVPLVYMCIYAINLQNGYKTNIYYSAIQTIIIQAIIFLSWIVDWKRGERYEFYERQNFQVQNSFEELQPKPIGIGEGYEIGGSTQQFLKSHRKIQQSGSRLPEWQRKRTIPFSEGALSIQLSQPQKEPSQNEIDMNELESPTDRFKKRKSLFKFKILDQWRQLSKNLPNANTKLKLMKKSREYISKSPYSRISKPVKKIETLKKSSSLDKIEVKFIDPTIFLKFERSKQYSYKFYNGQNPDSNRSMISSVKEKSPKQLREKERITQKIFQNVDQKNKNKNIDEHIQKECHIQESLDARSQREIQTILETNEQKPERDEQNSFKLQNNKYKIDQKIESKSFYKEQNLANILDDLTQNNDQKHQQNPNNHQSGLKIHEIQEQVPFKATVSLKKYEIADYSEPASSNRLFKNTNFTKSTETFQHRYNNLVRQSDVQNSQLFKNLNKSQNATNSMDVSLPKAIFENDEISEDQHRPTTRQKQTVINLTGPNLKEQEERPRIVSKKKKKKEKLVKLSKPQQQIQKRYLGNRMPSADDKNSGVTRRYQQLSNF